MNKNKQDEGVVGATIVCIVYEIGMFLILNKLEGSFAFLLWIVWTLAVILYVVIHDYIIEVKNSVHERIKEVSKAEMRFLEERKRFYEEMEKRK